MWSPYLLALALVASSAGAQTTTRPPQGPIVFPKAHPFETGPRLGPWVARCNLRVFKERGSRKNLSFELHNCESFNHHYGDLIVEQVGIIRMLVSVGEYKPGDRVYLLDYRGEGVFGCWFNGESFPCGFNWSEKPGPGVEGIVEQQPEMTWWVRVSNSEGRFGWLALHNIAHSTGINFKENIDMWP